MHLCSMLDALLPSFGRVDWMYRGRYRPDGSAYNNQFKANCDRAIGGRQRRARQVSLKDLVLCCVEIR